MSDHLSGLTSLELDRLAARITRIEDNLRSISTTPQLATSSIVDGAIDQIKLVDTGTVDENGNPIYAEQVVARIGEQEDSSNGAVVFDGPIPPQPTGFTVTGGAGILTVEWLGEFEDRIEPYLDHDYVAIHVGTTPDFQPMADTLMGTIRAPQGERVTLSGFAPGSYYVTLVSVSTAGRTSEPAMFDSDEALAGVDPVRVDAIEAKADEALSAAQASQTISAEAQRQANLADQKAIQAQKDATTALTTSGGKNTVTWSTENPPGTPGLVGEEVVIVRSPDGTPGDTWFVRETGSQYNILRQSRYVADLYAETQWAGWTGPGWMLCRLTDTVIANLTAGKITSGILGVGQVITVGDPASGTYLEIGNSSLQVYRPSEVGSTESAVTLSLGGSSADSFLLTDTSGATIAGFDSTGQGQADTLVTNALTVGGQSLGQLDNPDDILADFGRGRVAGYIIPSNSPQASSELGIAEVAFDIKPRRLYRVVFDGQISATTAASGWRLFLRYELGDENNPARAPKVGTSPQLSMGFFGSVAAQYISRCHLEGFLFYGSSAPCRVLLSLQRLTGGYPYYYYDGTGYLYVEDMGPTDPVAADVWSDGQMTTAGGTPYSGTATTPTTTKKTYTKTYSATWSRAYRGSSVDSTTEMRTGYSSGSKMTGSFGVSSQMQSDLSGASISKIEVFLYAKHWYYNNGGTLWYGPHGLASAASSFPGEYANASINWNTKTGGKWITLPAAWYPSFANGSYKGISIGGFVSAANNTFYSRHYGAGTGSTYEPKIRVTYTK